MNLDLFKKSIQSTISVNKSEMGQILSASKQAKIAKGELVIEEGTFCNQYYFLEKGLLRFVYHAEGIEETSWVIFEGTFFTEIVSLKSKEVTNMSLEAMESSTVLSIDEIDLDKLCDKVKPFEKYLRLTWEENLYHVIQMKLLQQF